MMTSLELAAEHAGYKLQPGRQDHFAMISGPRHHTPEEILKGEPFLFGQLTIADKADFYPIRIVEKDGKEVAEAVGQDGKAVATYPAQLSVPRLKQSPSPLWTVGGVHCWLSVSDGGGFTVVSFNCGGVNEVIIIR